MTNLDPALFTENASKCFFIFSFLSVTTGIESLETFSVDNGWSRFVILFLGDPHLLEGRERSQDRSSNPYRVFSLRWSNDLDFHGGWSQSSQLLLHSVSNSREHSRSSREHNISVEILSDINITLHDGVVSGFVNTSRFHTSDCWVVESFGESESFVTYCYDLSVGYFV
jgi:hypothetical protein